MRKTKIFELNLHVEFGRVILFTILPVGKIMKSPV